MKHLIVSVMGLFLLMGLGSPVFAENATIDADHLEYIKEEGKYIATGNVVITKDGVITKADKAVYHEESGQAELIGHVSIDDKDFLIDTDQADFNMDEKTGSLNNAIIYFKRENYWIKGINMQKLGDKHYYAKTAYFTACDSESYRTAKVLSPGKIPISQKPDWCFKGDNTDIVVGDRFTASNFNYRVKDVPVLYSPYFWGPVASGRQTGFLIPTVGTSTEKGFRFNQPFFWAIDENKDATFNVDYYSKRGVGTGAQYRFVDINHEGNWYAYHISDSVLHKDFYEVKGSDKFSLGSIQGFLDVNYINDLVFNKEYPKDFQSSISRFLQSSGEVSVPIDNTRAYFLSQYWINLREGLAEHVPQKLPELGYVVNPIPLGPAVFTLSASAANFYRSTEPHGQRLDIQPALSYAFGDAVRLTQTVSVRETAYNLEDAGNSGSDPHREMFQYRAQVQTRFQKNYETFMHIVEPSVEYFYIPSAKVLPLFDSTELPSKTSLVILSLLNKFVFEGLDISLRLSQPYDFNGGTANQALDGTNPYALFGILSPVETGHSLLPTRLQGVFAGPAIPANFNFDAAYDFGDGSWNSFNSNINFKVFRDVTLSLGESYSKIDNAMYMTVGLNAMLDKRFGFILNTSYDAKGPGLRDASLQTIYKGQCWNVSLVLTRRPGDTVRPPEYAYMILLELKGIGGFKI